MKIIDKGNYKNFIENNVLKVDNDTEIQLEEIDNLTIIGESNNKITVGNNCNIKCGALNKIKVGDDNTISTGVGCLIEAGLLNTIVTGANCKLKVQDENNIKTGRHTEIEGNDVNKIKAGESCQIKGGNENIVMVKSGSRVFIFNNCEIEIKGKNIILEIKGWGGSATIRNKAKKSVILTKDLKGGMKIYKTKKLTKETAIMVEDGIIGSEYHKNKF